jgi:deoxyadenosine kinase
MFSETPDHLPIGRLHHTTHNAMSNQPIEHLYISISGLIGAGKTTLAERLSELIAKQIHLKEPLKIYREPVDDNPYLTEFYKNMEKHAFALQIHLLNARLIQQREIAAERVSAIQDRTIYEDKIFAEVLAQNGQMSQLNLATYLQLFQTLSSDMRRPTLIVHLDVTPEVALERIKKRGRACEQSITLEYLKQLHAGYEKHLSEISNYVTVIRVAYNHFPSAELVAEKVLEQFLMSRTARYVTF